MGKGRQLATGEEGEREGGRATGGCQTGLKGSVNSF